MSDAEILTQPARKYSKILGTGDYSHVNVTKAITVLRHKIAQNVLLQYFIQHILFWALFAACILLQREASASSGVSSAIRNSLLSTPFRDRNYALKTWEDIRSIEDFWDWHQTVLIDTFYVDQYYSGTPTNIMDSQTIMQHIKFIDGIRLTQRRGRNNTCLVDNSRFSTFLSNCYGPTFANGLNGFVDEAPFLGAVSGDTYKHETKSSVEGGYYVYLSGGGFREDARATLRKLRADLWLNEGTTWARTDFVGYNANAGLFSCIAFQVSFSRSGTLLPELWVQSMRYKPYATQLDYLLLALEAVFVASLFAAIGQNVLISVSLARMYGDALAFTNHFWCAYDWLLLTGMLACVCLRAYLVLVDNFISIRVPDPTLHTPSLTVVNSSGEFLDLYTMASLTWVYFVLCGLLLGLSGLKIIRFMRINILLSVVTQTFAEMGMEVLLFFGIQSLQLFMWAAMAVVLFGTHVHEFRDLSSAWQTCWLLFIGVITREEVFRELPTDEYSELPIEAELFFYPFTLVMTFAILNVSTGIIMTAYTKVTQSFADMRENSVLGVLVARPFTEQLAEIAGLHHHTSHISH